MAKATQKTLVEATQSPPAETLKVDKAPMTQIAMESQSPLDLGFEVKGLSFRWINADVRNQMQSWAHWTVVTRDSELGEKVAQGLQEGHMKFEGGNEGNYFQRGSLVLAWAPEEVVQARRESLNEKADDRLRQVVKGDTTLRQTYISAPRK